MGRYGGAVVLLFLCLISPASAGHQHYERWYQQRWCAEAGGEMEVTLPDGTRCDCLTDDHAVELDFGPGWAEAIGQALYYGLQTGRQPGVVLILEEITDRRYWIRLNTTIDHFRLPIKVWAIGAGE